MKKKYISPRCEVIEFKCAESVLGGIFQSEGEDQFSNRREFGDNAPAIWDSCNWDGTDEEE